jgi:hypothetical protein
MFIALFASTVPDRGGLNTNTTDFMTQYSGRSFSQLRATWTLLKDLLDQDRDLVFPPRTVGPGGAVFAAWFGKTLEPSLKNAGILESAFGVEALVQRISPLADTGKFPHFPPFRDGAFAMRRPLLRSHKRQIIRMKKAGIKNARLKPDQKMYRESFYTPSCPLLTRAATVPAGVERALGSVRPKQFKAFAAQFDHVDLDSYEVNKKADNMPRRLAQPVKRSTRNLN